MSAPPGTVSLQDLSLEQIAQVRSQLEQVRASQSSTRSKTTPLTQHLHHPQELKHLTAAFGDLKAAQSKFMACMESLDSIKTENRGEFGLHLPLHFR
jgi:prefoldin alpha subunit